MRRRLYAAPIGSIAEGYLVEVTQEYMGPQTTGYRVRAFLQGNKVIARGHGQIYNNISNTVQPFHDRCRNLEKKGWVCVADESQPIGASQKRFRIKLSCGDTEVVGESGFLTRQWAEERAIVITETLNNNLIDFDPTDELLSYTIEEYEE